MKIIQTHLVRPNGDRGMTHLYTWLPIDPRVKPGVKITLDDQDNTWVWEVKDQFMTSDTDNLNTKWGLALPKSQRTER